MAFRNPIVAGEELTLPGIRSENYVEGVTGWRIAKDGSVQFFNADILGRFRTLDDEGAELIGSRNDGSFFAETFESEDYILDGDSLKELLVKPALGSLASSRHQVLDRSLPEGAEVSIWKQTVQTYGNRDIRIEVTCEVSATSDTKMFFRLRKTETAGFDSVPPSISLDSPTFLEPKQRDVIGNGRWKTNTIVWRFHPGSDEVAAFLFTARSISSAGDIRNFEMSIDDTGQQTSVRGDQVYATSGGSTTDPDTTRQYDYENTFADHYSWTQFGENIYYSPQYVRHGKYGSSEYRTYLPKSATMQSRLAASDSLDACKIWLTGASGANPTKLWYGLYKGNASSGAEPDIFNAAQSTTVFRSGSKNYIKITDSLTLARLRSTNYDGVVIGKKGYAIGIDLHGTSASVSKRPALEYTITK